jgi:hypothetical protein
VRRLAWGLLALTLAACAHSGGQIVRDDWVVFPGRDGKEVMSRADYVKSKPRRGHRASNMERIPPPLLSAGPEIVLGVGEVKTFLLVDEPVRSLTLTGGAAQVFWSKPYQIDRMENGHLTEHPGADVHFRGIAPGRAELQVELSGGGIRTVRVNVRAGARGTVGS